MQSKSKLGKSLMHTIEGGKPKEQSESVDTAFAEAEKGESYIDEDESRGEPYLGNISENMEDPVSTTPVDVPEGKKPEKVKKIKKGSTQGFVVGMALVVSLLAVSIAGFSVLNQRANKTELETTYSNIDEAIGALTSRTDEVVADLSNAKKSLDENEHKLTEIAAVKENVSAMQASVEELKLEVKNIKSLLDSNRSGIEKNKTDIGRLESSVETISNRPIPKTLSSKPLPKKSVSYDPTVLEDATVASIDQWGTSSYVMLRNSAGDWIPLSMGDYYKGWRYLGSEDEVAIFEKSSKKRRLIIKE